MENADGSRQELYRLDLWNATAAPETLDWHEMDNLVAAEPERASKMAYSLHAWLASLPAGPFMVILAGAPLEVSAADSGAVTSLTQAGTFAPRARTASRFFGV